jgi:ankyrin repeat protein
LAVKQLNYTNIALLMDKHNADIEATDVNGNTPLIWMCKKKSATHMMQQVPGSSLEFIQKLLLKGANVDAQNVDGIVLGSANQRFRLEDAVGSHAVHW